MLDTKVQSIPLSVIEGAVKGENSALEYVLSYYEHYINQLATRTTTNEYGEQYCYVDDEIVARLKAKLICSIINSFKLPIE